MRSAASCFPQHHMCSSSWKMAEMRGWLQPINSQQVKYQLDESGEQTYTTRECSQVYRGGYQISWTYIVCKLES
jgi:hypothetical protein